jgi:hypothetical protein
MNSMVLAAVLAATSPTAPAKMFPRSEVIEARVNSGSESGVMRFNHFIKLKSVSGSVTVTAILESSEFDFPIVRYPVVLRSDSLDPATFEATWSPQGRTFSWSDSETQVHHRTVRIEGLKDTDDERKVAVQNGALAAADRWRLTGRFNMPGFRQVGCGLAAFNVPKQGSRVMFQVGAWTYESRTYQATFSRNHDREIAVGAFRIVQRVRGRQVRELLSLAIAPRISLKQLTSTPKFEHVEPEGSGHDLEDDYPEVSCL